MFGGERPDEVGVRDPTTILWSEINILPPQAEGLTVEFVITGIDEPETETSWRPFMNFSFVYRDGGIVPPLLRDQPDQNFLSYGLRGLGLALMSVALFTAVVCATWVFLRRKHRVLKASQPPFLYVIAFGTAVEAFTIFTISNDESYGWSEESLSRACIAAPWLLTTGTIIIYS
jgi:hypothetical protein